MGLGWDEKLTGDTLSKWLLVVESLKEVPIFSISRLWHCGHDWLLTVQDERQPATECLTEMKAKNKMTHSLITSTATINLESVIPCKRYRKFSHLILVTTYVMKFVHALKQAIKDRDRHCTDVNLTTHP